MPNRIIKESICYSDDIDTLTPYEEIFFYRLLVNCDDYGVIDGRIKVIRCKCFPLKDNVEDLDIEKWIKRLCDKKLIYIYTNDCRQYLMVSKWDKHQQIRAKRSKYPLPKEKGSEVVTDFCKQTKSDDIKCNQEKSSEGTFYRNPIQSNPNPNLNPNPNPNPNLNPSIQYSDFLIKQCNDLWNIYPKKIGKVTAFEKLPELIKEFTYEQLERCIQRYTLKIKSKDMQFVKQGDTFFNGGYVDYLDKEYGGDQIGKVDSQDNGGGKANRDYSDFGG